MQAGLTIEEKLAALKDMGTAELRREWEHLNGETPRSYNRQFLFKRICWMHQAAVWGGLSDAAKHRIDELLPTALAWMPISRAFSKGTGAVSPVERGRSTPKPGSVITRAYRGRTLQLVVREDARFELDGKIYPSLTAAAEGATGSHWNGTLFWFGRRKKSAGGLILGYDLGAHPGRLVVNEAEAKRVVAIFGLFLETGSIIATVQELARRHWTLKAWTTKDGKPYGGGRFDKFSLKRLLTNHAYVGEVAFDGAVYPGEQELIVDRQTWDAVQNLLSASTRNYGYVFLRGDLANNARSALSPEGGNTLAYFRIEGLSNDSAGPRRRSTKNASLLAGILRCSPCDSAMTPTYSGRNGRRYRYYLCQKAHRNGWASCPSKSVPAIQIEKFVVDQIRAIGRDHEFVATTVEAARQTLATRRSEMETAVRDTQKALDTAHAAARAQIAAAGDGRSRQRRDDGTGADVAALEEHLARLRDDLDTLRGLRIDPADLRAALAAFAPVWDHLTSAERARIVGLLIERIDYDGAAGRIGITFAPAGVLTLASEAAARVAP